MTRAVKVTPQEPAPTPVMATTSVVYAPQVVQPTVQYSMAAPQYSVVQAAPQYSVVQQAEPVQYSVVQQADPTVVMAPQYSMAAPQYTTAPEYGAPVMMAAQPSTAVTAPLL